jgi:hypothetical protein
LATIDQITGGAFQDPAGNVLNGGSISFQLSSPAQTINDGQAVQDITITYPLNASGSVAASPLYGNDQLTPTGTFYSVRIYNAAGALVRGPENWVIGGSSPIDLGTIAASTPSSSYSAAVLLNPAGPQTINGNITINGTLALSNTVGNSIPNEIKLVALTAQAAAIPNTTIFTTGASGLIRISWNAKVTIPGTTTSILGPLTLYYTDADGVAQTLPMAYYKTLSGDLAGGGAGRISNTTASGMIGIPAMLSCQAASTVAYAFGWGSTGATPMQYELNILTEQL